MTSRPTCGSNAPDAPSHASPCPPDPLGLSDQDAWALASLPGGGWLAIASETRAFARLDDAIRHVLR